MTSTESDFDAITELWNRARDETSNVQLTQVDLADAFGISQSKVSQIVNGGVHDE